MFISEFGRLTVLLAPIKVLPTLHFNGLRILNASLEELGQLGLRHAETVVLTGVGHGGTAAVLHADRIHAALKAIAPNLVSASFDNGSAIYCQRRSLSVLHSSSDFARCSCSGQVQAGRIGQLPPAAPYRRVHHD
eukprot:SAG31_NODE_174_length_21353_cov_23.387974_19_plen_135_part_00